MQHCCINWEEKQPLAPNITSCWPPPMSKTFSFSVKICGSTSSSFVDRLPDNDVKAIVAFAKVCKQDASHLCGVACGNDPILS